MNKKQKDMDDYLSEWFQDESGPDMINLLTKEAKAEHLLRFAEVKCEELRDDIDSPERYEVDEKVKTGLEDIRQMVLAARDLLGLGD